ncbi:AAA family ATPase [Aceticella autotrophica]|uniref:AAA family ATPase n=1 Tax=Aceticella autotrophica TaxID=2755338 RepID=A0A975AW67_9THEO|nr:AAA family ATPase [Aceticella autotrophica]QSZ27605.1 AAA family ATPase [Aceticella autotrophica]
MIISIFSPKGGVGKTTITLALADSLSKDKKVCVVEFDFSPGDFASTLNVDKNKNILRAIKYGIKKTAQKPQNKNFDVITGGYPDTHEKISTDDLDRLMDELSSVYDMILFDIQPGLIENAVVILERCDYAFAIAEDTEAIKVRMARILQWLKIDFNKIKIILNKAKGNLKNIGEIASYTIPYFGENITYENRGMRKSIQTIADMLEGKKPGFFAKPLKEVSPEQIEYFIKESLKNFPQDSPEDPNKNNTINQTIFNENKEGKSMVYIKTNLNTLNNFLQEELCNINDIKIDLTDNFDECDTAVVSALSKEEIDRYALSNKKIILLTLEQYKEYAQSKGIKIIFSDKCSDADLINAIRKNIEEKTNVTDSAVESKDIPISEGDILKDTPVIAQNENTINISEPQMSDDIIKENDNIVKEEEIIREESVNHEETNNKEISDKTDIENISALSDEINAVLNKYISSLKEKIEEKYIDEIKKLKESNRSLLQEIKEKNNTLTRVEKELKERRETAEQLKKLLLSM